MNKKRLSYVIIIIITIACTILSASTGRVLKIKNLSLSPNPFSPHSSYVVSGGEQGLRIAFEVETLSRFFWLTVKVYNLQGSLVRTITELEPMYTDAGDKFGEAEIEIRWDGKTNQGVYANNGRYIVHIKVSDTEAETFSTEELKPVVLIK